MCFGSGFFAVHCWIRIDFAEDFEAPTDVCESGMEPSASKVAAKKKNVSTSNFYNVEANHPPWSRPPFIQSTPVLKHTWALRN